MGTRSYTHAPNTGTVGSLVPTVSGRGVPRPVYQYDYEQDADDLGEYEGDDIEFDDYEALHAKINTRTLDLATPRQRGSSQYYVGGNNVFEYAGDHMNYARKGISPFKQPPHSGPPLGGGGSNQAFRTSGNYIGIGTQHGSSRPHALLTDIDDNPAYEIDDLPDPMERSFLRHNNRVKKVLSVLKEYLNDEII
tara:strand:+ start:1589 stop:2167 length:579 start_codon:yes stop_codon:yes gene_type:complete